MGSYILLGDFGRRSTRPSFIERDTNNTDIRATMTSHGSLPSLVHPIIGVVRGVRASTQVVQYLGVPYATLQDAFARAQPITYMKSEFVLNATQHG
jgi:hypothetical protein